MVDRNRVIQDLPNFGENRRLNGTLNPLRDEKMEEIIVGGAGRHYSSTCDYANTDQCCRREWIGIKIPVFITRHTKRPPKYIYFVYTNHRWRRFCYLKSCCFYNFFNKNYIRTVTGPNPFKNHNIFPRTSLCSWHVFLRTVRESVPATRNIPDCTYTQ